MKEKRLMLVKTHKSASILVVDDNLTIRLYLKKYLKANGYSVFLAENGEKALQIAHERVPDLVLMDIVMPEMNGFKVCEELKGDLHTRDIPVLFITTLSDAGIHKKAIECGGQGFITKPFSEDLLNAYVKTFLEKKKALDEIEKMAEWQNSFMNTGIHDLNNLLFTITSNLELAVFEGNREKNPEKRIERALSVLQSVVEMVHKFQEMLKLGSSEYQLNTDVIDMRKLLERSLLIFEEEMRLKGLGFLFRGFRNCRVHGDENLLERVMMNLLGNAVKFARVGTDICFEAFEIKDDRSGEDVMEFFLHNECVSLPQDSENIFEMFQQGSHQGEKQRGKGIGLYFCRSALEKLRGSIWAEFPLKGQSKGFGIHFILPIHSCSKEREGFSTRLPGGRLNTMKRTVAGRDI